MHALTHTLFQFYGLDWMTMIFGLTGSYMISNRDKRGLAINALACVFGLSVALLSGQAGFVAYNAILILLMCKGLLSWNQPQLQTRTIEVQ
ncbi:MAG: putative rane protein [Micavibrio sp.]|nr:putative rane protein [Micavibrio sp.]